MYGALPNSSSDSSLSLGYSSQAAGTWSIAIGKDVLTNADNSKVCNVGVGTDNLYNLTTGSFNTAIGQNSTGPSTYTSWSLTPLCWVVGQPWASLMSL